MNGSRYSNSKCACSFDCYLPLLILRTVSICDVRFLFGVSYYAIFQFTHWRALKGGQWITIRWAKFELERLLLILIYFSSKFKVTCKKGDFEAGKSELIPKKKRQTFAILHFSPAKCNCHPKYTLSLQFVMKLKPSDTLQYGSF